MQQGFLNVSRTFSMCLTSKAVKHFVRPALAAKPSIFGTLIRQQRQGVHQTSTTLYAIHQDNDWPSSSPGKSHPLMEQLAQHPHIMRQLVDFTAFIQTKGIDASGKQLNYMQIMKVMQDPEVKAKVQQLAGDMHAAGIKLDMASIAELQQSLGQPPTSINQDETNEKTPSQQDDKGVMNKVKGFFKK